VTKDQENRQTIKFQLHHHITGLGLALDDKVNDKRHMFRIKLLISIVAIILMSCSCRKDKDQVSHETEILNDIVTQINNHHYGEVHSLIIAKNDSIIFEKYFNNYSRDIKHPLYSVTKSFTSALIGICIDKGYIDSIGMKVLDFFPEYKYIINHDSLKERMTIRDLLTMTSGLTWDEWSTSYNDPGNDVIKLIESNDWIKYVLERPMSHDPGTYVTYNSGVSNLLSGIITKATGKSASEIARDNLFSVLGITDWTWDKRPDGVSIGGWGLSLRPIDMVKFGQLYLKKGLWKNVQVISQGWIDESTMPHYQINHWCDYGYQWWRYNKNMEAVNASGIMFAAGRGEQFIWVIPDHNAVAVCTGWNDGQSILEPVLWEYILKALDN
jgi:CubicO group peptidase (beta-lactamase class C family)